MSNSLQIKSGRNTGKSRETQVSSFNLDLEFKRRYPNSYKFSPIGSLSTEYLSFCSEIKSE